MTNSPTRGFSSHLNVETKKRTTLTGSSFFCFGGGQHSALRAPFLFATECYSRIPAHSLSHFHSKSPLALWENAHGTFSPTRGFVQYIPPKQKRRAIARLSFWRRTWDSNPRGCYTLLDFQSSSLATRSILQIASNHNTS